MLGTILRGSSPEQDENGLVALSSAAECTEPYHGQFTGASVFIVGRGTEHERLFVRGHKMDAMRWAKQHSVTLDHVHVTNLCHEPVLALLGA